MSEYKAWDDRGLDYCSYYLFIEYDQQQQVVSAAAFTVDVPSIYVSPEEPRAQKWWSDAYLASELLRKSGVVSAMDNAGK